MLHHVPCIQKIRHSMEHRRSLSTQSRRVSLVHYFETQPSFKKEEKKEPRGRWKMTKDWDWMEASSEEKNRVTLKFFSGIFLFLIIFPLHLSHLQITAKAPTARNAWNMKFKREPFLRNSRIFVKASLQSFLHSLLFQIEPTNPIDFIQTYFFTDLRLHKSKH